MFFEKKEKLLLRHLKKKKSLSSHFLPRELCGGEGYTLHMDFCVFIWAKLINGKLKKKRRRSV